MQANEEPRCNINSNAGILATLSVAARCCRGTAVLVLAWCIVWSGCASIGPPMLFAYWKDSEFDPKQRAFHSVRVLEIQTPRWTTYDAAFSNVELPKDVPSIHQERAHTSLTWHMP